MVSKLMAGLCLLILFAPLSCVTGPQPYKGFLYTDVRGPNQALASTQPATKVGRSCASSALILLSWGDATIESARKDGGIKRIATVDYESTQVLGFIYSRTCTVVSGT